MHLPDSSRPPELVNFDRAIERRTLAAARAGASVSARVARLPTDLANRIGATTWLALHVLGAHRWREGYETDLDRGWSRYRGSRCTICDESWEGW